MIEKFNIGSDVNFGGHYADGQWVKKSVDVFSNVTFTSTGTTAYTVSNYLPDDLYSYEILVDGFGFTGTTAGDSCNWWVVNQDSNYNSVIGYSTTRTTSNVGAFGTAIIPNCKQTGGVLTLKVAFTGVGGGTGGNSLALRAYRRQGSATND